jgi:hypothetical protein
MAFIANMFLPVWTTNDNKGKRALAFSLLRVMGGFS